MARSTRKPSSPKPDKHQPATRAAQRHRETSIFRAAQTSDGFQLLSTRSVRDLLANDHQRVLAESFYLWKNNPTFRNCITKIQNFVTGGGVELHARSERVQPIIDDMLGEGPDSVAERLDKWFNALLLYGELLLPVFVGDSRLLSFGYKDALEIVENIPDPDDSQRLIATRCRVAQAGGAFTSLQVKQYPLIQRRRFGGYNIDWSAVLNGTGDSIGALYFGPQRALNGTRSHPPFMAAHNFFDLEQQFIYTAANRSRLLLNVLLQVAVDGDAKERDRLREKFEAEGPPPPESVEVTSANVDYKWHAPDLGANDANQIYELILHKIAHGTGLPIHWLTKGDEVTYASSQDISYPTFKMLQSMQTTFCSVLKTICELQVYLVTQNGGGLTPQPDEDLCVDVILPTIIREDEDQKLDRLTKLGSLLTNAQVNNWVRPEVAAQIFAKHANEEGIEVPEQAAPLFGPNGSVLSAPPDKPKLSTDQLDRVLAQLAQRQGAITGRDPLAGVDAPEPAMA